MYMAPKSFFHSPGIAWPLFQHIGKVSVQLLLGIVHLLPDARRVQVQPQGLHDDQGLWASCEISWGELECHLKFTCVEANRTICCFYDCPSPFFKVIKEIGDRFIINSLIGCCGNFEMAGIGQLTWVKWEANLFTLWIIPAYSLNIYTSGLASILPGCSWNGTLPFNTCTVGSDYLFSVHYIYSWPHS